MAIPLKPLDPRIQMSPRMWVGLLWGCLTIASLLFGFLVATLVGPPIPNGLTPLLRGFCAIMVALTMVILGLTTRHLTHVLVVGRATWHWVLLGLGVVSVVAVAITSRALRSGDDPILLSLGLLLASGLMIGVASAVTMYALVLILSSYAPDAAQHAAPHAAEKPAQQFPPGEQPPRPSSR